MRGIKSLFDPDGILNPGKVLPRVMESPTELDTLLIEIRACRICEASLPWNRDRSCAQMPAPVCWSSAKRRARWCMAAAFPGAMPAACACAAGWEWIAMPLQRGQCRDRAEGFCYPGRGVSATCRRDRSVRARGITACCHCLPNIQLVLAIGQYAQVYFLGDQRKKTLTETVMAWQEYAPRIFPLPHPSPRNIGWFKHNPWFDDEVVPALRKRVTEVLS
jgi:uracil-DNA glycosylase